MRAYFSGWSRWVVPVLFLSLASCGDDDGELISVPQAEPTPQPSGSGGEEEQALWSRLYLRWDSEVRNPAECVYPRRFRLYATGRYRAGPCEPNSNIIRVGNITDGERIELNRRANLVVQSAPSRTPECDLEPSMAPEELELRLPTGRTYDIYEVSPEDGTVCYRGGRANVISLLEYIGALEQRYYPTRRPRPTPSPSPSVTPSPSPSVTPSPSPSASPLPTPPPIPIPPDPTPLPTIGPEADD